MKHIAEPCNDSRTIQQCYEALIKASQHVVNVLDDVAHQTDLEHERWQVVVQEERTLEEEIWQQVEQIAKEEGEADVLEFHPFLVV